MLQFSEREREREVRVKALFYTQMANITFVSFTVTQNEKREISFS